MDLLIDWIDYNKNNFTNHLYLLKQISNNPKTGNSSKEMRIWSKQNLFHNKIMCFSIHIAMNLAFKPTERLLQTLSKTKRDWSEGLASHPRTRFRGLKRSTTSHFSCRPHTLSSYKRALVSLVYCTGIGILYFTFSLLLKEVILWAESLLFKSIYHSFRGRVSELIERKSQIKEIKK